MRGLSNESCIPLKWTLAFYCRETVNIMFTVYIKDHYQSIFYQNVLYNGKNL